jgi:hypothetical protein
MYTIAIGLVLTYLILYKLLFPRFFDEPISKLGQKSLFSLLIIVIISVANYLLIYYFLDIESGIGNRILHAFGGGFMTFLVCYLVVKDSRLPINKFQFFIISVLIVASLGIVNEIYEFILQNYFDVLAAATINDTWLDLISNSVGTLVASVCFVPFVNRKKS